MNEIYVIYQYSDLNIQTIAIMVKGPLEYRKSSKPHQKMKKKWPINLLKNEEKIMKFFLLRYLLIEKILF